MSEIRNTAEEQYSVIVDVKIEDIGDADVGPDNTNAFEVIEEPLDDEIGAKTNEQTSSLENCENDKIITDKHAEHKIFEDIAIGPLVKHDAKNATKEFPYKAYDIEFNKNYSLKSHMAIHSKEQAVVSDVCNRYARVEISRKEYELAERKLNNYLFSTNRHKHNCCDISEKCLKINKDFNKHIRVHTEPTPYYCSMCKKYFNCRQKFKIHLALHIGWKPYCCDICKKCFSGKSYLISHLRLHTGEKPYCCDICKKPFRHKTRLNRHLRVHTEGQDNANTVQDDARDTKKQFKISYEAYDTDKEYNMEHNLKSKPAIYSEKRALVNKLCNAGYARVEISRKEYELAERKLNSYNLLAANRHKHYCCDIPEKCFKMNKDLDNHIRVHTEPTPYYCSMCKKYFSCRQRFKTHIGLHIGGRPYWCDICKNFFSQKLNLIRHLRVHSGGKP